jgi:hypothetical protein
MIGQQQHEDEQPQNEQKHGGCILQPDDLDVGMNVCVYSLKKSPEEGAAILGQSLKIQAICFPYFVGQLLSDPSEPVLTLDVRFLNLMKVSDEFVKAQQAGVQSAKELMQGRKKKNREQENPQQ